MRRLGVVQILRWCKRESNQILGHYSPSNSFHLNHCRISRRLVVRLWFAANSEVPIYGRLVTKDVLAILSGDVLLG